jgi:hypothetical protein
VRTSLRYTYVCVLSLLLSSATAIAQYPNNPLPPWVYETAKKKDDFQRLNRGRTRPALTDGGIRRNISLPESALFELWQPPLRLRELLKPPPKYFDDFGKYLDDHKDAGLVRLFVDRGCDQGITISADEKGKCDGYVPMKGGGSNYSFRFRTHWGLGDYGWDTSFTGSSVLFGSDTVEAIVARLDSGDVVSVTEKAPEVQGLSSFAAASTRAGIIEQRTRLERGVSLGGRTYCDRAVVALNAAYVVRFVAKERPKSIDPGSADWFGRGSDSRIAFKIVGVENDGSIVIFWRLIGKKTVKGLLIDR